MRLTQLLCHLLHNKTCDICYGSVPQAFEGQVILIVKLSSTDAAIRDMGVQHADEDEKAQKKQGKDQLLHRDKQINYTTKTTKKNLEKISFKSYSI